MNYPDATHLNTFPFGPSFVNVYQGSRSLLKPSPHRQFTPHERNTSLFYAHFLHPSCSRHKDLCHRQVAIFTPGGYAYPFKRFRCCQLNLQAPKACLLLRLQLHGAHLHPAPAICTFHIEPKSGVVGRQTLHRLKHGTSGITGRCFRHNRHTP